MKFGTSTLLVSLLLLSPSAFASDSFSALLSQSTLAGMDRDWQGGADASRELLALRGLTKPQRAAGFSHLCMHLTNLGAFADAAIACNRSVALDPASWSGYLNRGNLLLSTGDRLGARVEYKRAHDLNPASPLPDQALYSMTTVYVVPAVAGTAPQLAEAR